MQYLWFQVCVLLYRFIGKYQEIHKENWRIVTPDMMEAASQALSTEGITLKTLEEIKKVRYLLRKLF